MATVQKGRFTAAPDDDLVVFLIGMRINKAWKPHKWLPVFVAMAQTLRLLDKHPEAPIIGLAAVTHHVTIGSTKQTTALRIGAAEDEPAVAPYKNP